MSGTNTKNIIQIFYNIFVVMLSSIFSGWGYGYLAASLGVNDFGPLLEQVLFSYFVGGVAAALFLVMNVKIFYTFGGSILVAILTTIITSSGAYDLMAWVSGFFWNLSGESILGAFLTPSIISILVYVLLRLKN